MTRPRTVEDEAVLAAAIDVIGCVGPAEVTLARVAAEVGLSPATLVQRFGSKRNLLLAVARHGSGGGETAFDRARERHQSPLAVLVAGLCSLTSPVASPETMANHLAFLQLDLRDPDFHQLALAGARRLRERIERLLEEAAEAGELASCDTALLARAVQTTLNGALVTWAIYREGSVDEWLRVQLEALLGPYRTR